MSCWCVGMDEVPAISIPGYTDGGGLPGLTHTLPRIGGRGSEPYIFHFPDGNASVARLLVRKLIPEALPGKTMEDSVTARVDYTKLDQDGAAITVNRWPHGYSYGPIRTWEPDYASEEDKHWVKGRKPFGRITIANSDAGAAANTNSAITHAQRAVQEALSG